MYETLHVFKIKKYINLPRALFQCFYNNAYIAFSWSTLLKCTHLQPPSPTSLCVLENCPQQTTDKVARFQITLVIVCHYTRSRLHKVAAPPSSPCRGHLDITLCLITSPGQATTHCITLLKHQTPLLSPTTEHNLTRTTVCILQLLLVCVSIDRCLFSAYSTSLCIIIAALSFFLHYRIPFWMPIKSLFFYLQIQKII